MRSGKQKTMTIAMVALAILAGDGASAQNRTRDGTAAPSQSAAQGRSQGQSRGQIQGQNQRGGPSDRGRIDSRNMDRLTDRALDRDHDRIQDRDQLHALDSDQLRKRDIYGSDLMTRQERREYQDRIREMTTVQEWARFRAVHQDRILARAKQQGVELATPYYGQQLMTDQEREQLRERLDQATSQQARERILTEHRDEMRERAREHQIPLGDLD